MTDLGELDLCEARNLGMRWPGARLAFRITRAHAQAGLHAG